MNHQFIVHGSDGLDEFTTTTSTLVTEIKDGEIKSYEVKPFCLKLAGATSEDLVGGELKNPAR